MTVKLNWPRGPPTQSCVCVCVCVCVLRGQVADGTFHMPYQVNLEMARLPMFLSDGHVALGNPIRHTHTRLFWSAWDKETQSAPQGISDDLRCKVWSEPILEPQRISQTKQVGGEHSWLLLDGAGNKTRWLLGLHKTLLSLISTTGLSWSRSVSRDRAEGISSARGCQYFHCFWIHPQRVRDRAEAGPLSAENIWKETGDKDSEATVAKKSVTGGDRAWRTGLHSVQTVEI